MKRLLLLILLIQVGQKLFAQNTSWSTTGNIGIGLTNPQTPLEVSGTLSVTKAGASGDGNNLLLWNPTASTTTNDPRGGIWLDNDGRLKFRSVTGYGLSFVNTANTGDVFGISDQGVSIGATNPASGPLNCIGSLLKFTTGTHTSIQENWGINLCGDSIRPIRVYNSSLLIGYQSYSQNFGKNSAFISGNVGIGTTDTKGYALAVNGSGIATAFYVKTAANWPDYVFDSSYKLRTLADLKIYVDQNHHLPDLPTADEIAKNGINLGETEKQLTKKVEELTLYLIDKEEELHAQQTINSKQQRQLEDQALRISKLEAALEKLTTSK